MKIPKSKILSIGVFVVLICMNTERVQAQKSSGISEFWQELYIYHDFNEKWSGELLFNNLYSKKLGNYDWFLEGKVAFKANTWLSVEAMYRHEFIDLNGLNVQEYRPMLRVSAKRNLGKWNFRNRHRFEYRMFDVGESHARYRTDFKVSPNWNWTSLNLNPYLNEEIFIDRNGLSRNRIYLGIEGKKGRFLPAFYTLTQSDNLSGNWHNRWELSYETFLKNFLKL